MFILRRTLNTIAVKYSIAEHFVQEPWGWLSSQSLYHLSMRTWLYPQNSRKKTRCISSHLKAAECRPGRGSLTVLEIQGKGGSNMKSVMREGTVIELLELT